MPIHDSWDREYDDTAGFQLWNYTPATGEATGLGGATYRVNMPHRAVYETSYQSKYNYSTTMSTPWQFVS